MIRKIIPALVFLFMAFSASAQLVSSSSLVITREKLPAVKRGYEQSVDASYTMRKADTTKVNGIDLHYIGGYRFNSHIFLGAGTGLSFDFESQDQRNPYDEGALDIPAVSLPLFVFFKAYFLKTRVSPFFSLAAGGRFSTKKQLDLDGGSIDYSTLRYFANPALGVNYRINARHSIYFTAGWTISSAPYVKDVTFDSATVYNKMASVLDVHIGFTF